MAASPEKSCLVCGTEYLGASKLVLFVYPFEPGLAPVAMNFARAEPATEDPFARTNGYVKGNAFFAKCEHAYGLVVYNLLHHVFTAKGATTKRQHFAIE